MKKKRKHTSWPVVGRMLAIGAVCYIAAWLCMRPMTPLQGWRSFYVWCRAELTLRELPGLRTQVEVREERYKALATEHASKRSPLGAWPQNAIERLDRTLFEVRRAQGVYFALIGRQVDRFEGHLEAYPGDWRAKFDYGWFLVRVGQRYRALSVWRQVTETNPEHATALHNIGSLLTHMGGNMEAVDLFRRAIAIKPTDPVFHRNLAVMYSTQRNEIAKKDGSTLREVWHDMLAELLKARDLSRGDAEYHQEVARDLATQYGMSRFYGVRRSRGIEGEIKAWEYYLSLDLTAIQRSFATGQVGRVYLRIQGDYAQAMKYLKASRKLNRSPYSRDGLKELAATAERNAHKLDDEQLKAIGVPHLRELERVKDDEGT